MKIKLTNILRGKERKKKKEQICKVRGKGDLYTLKINCKGKKTEGKENKGVNCRKNHNRFKKF